jgi:hypothetical protein
VLLDSDLAELYGVRVSALNQAVKRNASRFPEDFFFRLNAHEADALKSQSVTSNPARGGRRRSTPAAFTEQGVAMLSSVLRSPRAVQVNIEIMRTFVRLRRLLATNEELRRKIHELERDTDDRFRVIFDAMRELMGDGAEPESSPKKPRIGFRAE